MTCCAGAEVSAVSSSSTAQHADAAPLTGRHALITGGARGIGAAVAHELARLGATLTIAGRSIEALEARRGELIARHGCVVSTLRMDVTDPQSVARAVAEATTLLGPLSILVNNAGRPKAHRSCAPIRRSGSGCWIRT